MTDKEAFIQGVQLFCKSAGLDDEDVAQVEHLLFMHPDAAEPIIERAQVSIRKVAYVNAGRMLEKRGGIPVPQNLTQILKSGDKYAYTNFVNNLLGYYTAQQQGTLDRKIGGPAEGAWTDPTQAAGESMPEDVEAAIRAGDYQKLQEAANNWWKNARQPQEGQGGNAWQTQTTETPGQSAAAGSAQGSAGGTGDDNPKIKQWDEEYESKYKDLGIPKQVYDRYRQTYDLYSGAGRAQTSLDDYMKEEWAGEQYSATQRRSKQMMRRYGIDMAPGQLAQMSDEEIEQRSKGNPGFGVSLRRARDQAKERERMQGGQAARAGLGFTTSTSGSAAAGAAAGGGRNASQTGGPVIVGPSTPVAAAQPAQQSSSPPTDQELAAASGAGRNAIAGASGGAGGATGPTGVTGQTGAPAVGTSPNASAGTRAVPTRASMSHLVGPVKGVKAPS